jgi:Holliday junction resolvase RusA-like endonuclease
METQLPPLNRPLVFFDVPGAPVGKGRPRFSSGVTKAGKRFTRAFTPPPTASYENLVKIQALKAMRGRAPFEGPLTLFVRAHLSIPSSWSRRKREQAVDGLIFPTVKPDLSNIVKAIEDAMNGIVYRDDAQISEFVCFKDYTAGAPRVTVWVNPRRAA